jgi:hypothetical protein
MTYGSTVETIDLLELVLENDLVPEPLARRAAETATVVRGLLLGLMRRRGRKAMTTARWAPRLSTSHVLRFTSHLSLLTFLWYQSTPRVPDVVGSQVRPAGTDPGLGGPAIGSLAVVKHTTDLVGRKVVARGNNLALDDASVRPLHLAQVGRTACAQQALQAVRSALVGRRDDLERQVAAAGRPSPVVGRAARSAVAGVPIREHGEPAAWCRTIIEGQDLGATSVDESQPAVVVGRRWPVRPLRGRWHDTHEAVRSARDLLRQVVGLPPVGDSPPPRRRAGLRSSMRHSLGRRVFVRLLKKPARHVHRRIDNESLPGSSRYAERDALGVSEKPGGQSVPIRGSVVVEVGNAQGDGQLAALAAEASAGRGRRHDGGRKFGWRSVLPQGLLVCRFAAYSASPSPLHW